MKVLVTGCNGQVGHCLTQQLMGRAEVLAADRQKLDITQEKAVKALVSRFKPNYIINAAAHTAVDRAEQEIEVSYAINRDGSRYLAGAAQENNAVILHLSTDYVFDGEKTQPYRESGATQPQSIYGKSKLAGEKAVMNACAHHLILRTAWVFGEHGNNFVKTMLRLGRERGELSIVGDQIGGPTYAGDIAAALIRMIEVIESGKEIRWGIYHFAGQPYVSWYDFAQEIFAQAEEKQLLKAPKLNPILTTDYPTPAKRPANSRLDCNKIKQQFSIDPSDWRSALNNIIEYK